MDNWYYIIPAIGVLAWGAVVITWIVFRNKRGEPGELAARLDAIDSRLAAVEKTLNDIP